MPDTEVDPLKQARVDIANLLANLDAHQETTGEYLEDDDAAVVEDIRQRWAATAQTPAACAACGVPGGGNCIACGGYDA